ncbi:8-oxoguanine DNA glycosylase, partial [Intestinimonas massiliensis]|nr:8-oxoguanine DNA glycosylase [Intestinimonas massiliensis (ex Afouda et al. 2020)]
DAFPVDTHIRRVLEAYYPAGFDLERYKGYGGILQQYLFYYDLAVKSR